jgi:hypothetical protein
MQSGTEGSFSGRYRSVSDEMKSVFGTKIYKIALSAGCTCPNRDGTLDSRGCLFCSSGGSGEFASDPTRSILDQIEQGKSKVSAKIKGGKYIAYFQAYSNTYGPVERLEKLFFEAAKHPDIVGLSIATRPDCLPDEVLELLNRLNRVKPVWVELGLQTIHSQTSSLIRSGFDLLCFEDAVQKLATLGIQVIAHLILGLPGETREMMLESVEYLGQQTAVSGIKLSMLHVLRNTDLADMFERQEFSLMSKEEYLKIICECIKRLPNRMVIHRLTGDGPKSLLIAPLWTSDKRGMINDIRRIFSSENVVQGELFRPK